MKIFYKLQFIIFILMFYILGSSLILSQSDQTFENKEKFLHSIADTLWQTIGVAYPKPDIILLKDTIILSYNGEDNHYDGNDAFFWSPTKKIYFGIEIYNICMSISKEALAAVLAHEMGHYFNNHVRSYTAKGYIISDQELKFIKNITNTDLDKYKAQETQADLFATFHCYSAGYDISSAMPKVLDKIYTEYDKPSENYYLSLSERQKIANIAKEKFKKLLPIYEAANKLSLIGKYEFSAKCFEYIIKNDFTSWDIYNNVGVGYALEALKYIEPKEKQFIFPIVLESNSQLTKLTDKGATSRGTGTRIEPEKKENLTLKAIDALKSAMYMNVNVTTPYINLACLYVMNCDNKQARNYAMKAEDMANKIHNQHLIDLASIIKAIIFYNENDSSSASLEFKSAERNPIGKYNLMILNGENPDYLLITPKEKGQDLNLRANEEIGNIELPDFDLDVEFSQSISYDDLDNLSVNMFEGNDIKAMKIGNKEISVNIIETKDNYKGISLRGIKGGSTKDMVTELYGTPTRILVSSDNEYLIFETLGIIFKIESGYVSGWILYNTI